MATIRRRNDKYQVQIRKLGQRSISRSFSEFKSARAWANQTEACLERAEIFGYINPSLTLADLIRRYIATVSVHKSGAKIEAIRLNALLRWQVCKTPVTKLTSEHFSSFRDERLRDGQRTCRYDLVLLQHILKLARTEWGIPLPSNPVELVKKPPPSKPRNRRLEPGEFEALRRASHNSRATYLWPLVELAIQTGMRRGELLKAEWRDLDLQGRKMTLRDTKNGEDRTIPLTLRATEIISHLPRTDERLLPVTPVAVRQAWDRLRRRAGIEDLHFHDLRHEAISRFFEMGLSVPEVALISGHKDYRMLARYTHLRAEDLVGKLS